MKICIINQLFSPYTKGGSEIIVESITNELKNLGHDIFVITCGKEQKTTTEKIINNIKIYRIGFEKYFAFQNIDNQNFIKRFLWRMNQLNNKYSFHSVYSILKKEKPDLVLSHNILGLGYSILKAIKILELNHIHTIHDVQLIEPSGILFPNSNLDSFKNKIYSVFTKNIFKNVKKIVSPSEILLKLHQKRGFFPFAETRVIKNPIKFKNLEIKNKDIKELRCLYLGQLESHKGIDILIQTFKKLVSNQFNLTIAGRGSLEKKIKNICLLVNNIDFYGSYNAEQEEELFKNHDVLIMPTLCFENSPMVIYEAMQNAIPVVVSKIGGIPELITEEENGFLFKTGDAEELINKLNYIYENKNLIPNMRNKCLEVAKNFDIKKYIDRIMNF